jgi:hypothetical protein
MTGCPLSAKTLKRLARGPYAPITGGETVAILRTNVIAMLLLEKLLAVGPMTETAVVELLDTRAPGRAQEVLEYGKGAGMISRIPGLGDEPAMILPTHVERHPIAA